jgi:hypothetical protein
MEILTLWRSSQLFCSMWFSADVLSHQKAKKNKFRSEWEWTRCNRSFLRCKKRKISGNNHFLQSKKNYLQVCEILNCFSQSDIHFNMINRIKSHHYSELSFFNCTYHFKFSIWWWIDTRRFTQNKICFVRIFIQWLIQNLYALSIRELNL